MASDWNLTQSLRDRAVKAVGFVIVFVNSCVNLESGEDDFRITNASDDFSPSDSVKNGGQRSSLEEVKIWVKVKVNVQVSVKLKEKEETRKETRHL